MIDLSIYIYSNTAVGNELDIIFPRAHTYTATMDRQQGGATVKDMIYRFRTGPPTSRKDRDMARHNGTLMKRMWYDGDDIQPKRSAAGAALK